YRGEAEPIPALPRLPEPPLPRRAHSVLGRAHDPRVHPRRHPSGLDHDPDPAPGRSRGARPAHPPDDQGLQQRAVRAADSRRDGEELGLGVRPGKTEGRTPEVVLRTAENGTWVRLLVSHFRSVSSAALPGHAPKAPAPRAG